VVTAAGAAGGTADVFLQGVSTGERVTLTVATDAVDVVRLHLSLASRIVVSTSPPGSSWPSDTAREVRVTRQADALEFEGTQITVLASAVLADNTRVPITYNDGLTLSSMSPQSIEVFSQQLQLLQVPESAQGDAGELVRAVWQPNNCSGGLSIEGNLTMSVDPPPAIGMTVTVSQSTVVPSNGAAQAAGFPSSASLSVALQFDGRVQSNLQGDSRTHYAVTTVSGDDGIITVSPTGAVTTTNASLNLTGIARITVTFDGQNVSDSVVVRVTNFAYLEMCVW